MFLGERALAAPETPIREQDVGVGLFGRAPGYETSQDPLVRVQASQLRKRLQQYFENEGRHEPVVIELPKGGYVPAFLPRASGGPAPELPARSRFLRTWLPWAAAAILACVCGALLVRDAGLQQRLAAGGRPTPTVNRFWRQVLGNGQHNYLVVADALLVVFEDALGRHMSVQEYQDKAFDAAAAQRIPDPAMRKLMLNIVGRMYTGLSDAAMARKLGLVCGLNSLPLDVVVAREVNASQLALHNLILLGSRRANPWVNLFEEKLNFRAGFEESPRAAFFVNTAPKPGERPEYRGEFGHLGYCRVAFLPNFKQTGNIILATGTDVASTAAGAEFLTDETWLRYLRGVLELPDAAPFPYFEVLLRGPVVNNTIPRFDFVACRRH